MSIAIGIFALLLFFIGMAASFTPWINRQNTHELQLVAALFLIAAAICFKPVAEAPIAKVCQNVAVMSADGKSAIGIPVC